MHAVDLTGAQVRGALFNGSRLRGVELVDVEINGELKNVVVNGVDIAPLVDRSTGRRREAGRGGQSSPQMARSTSLPSGSASVHQPGAFASLTMCPPAATAAAMRAWTWSWGR